MHTTATTSAAAEVSPSPAPVAEPLSFEKDLTGCFNGTEIAYRAVAGETYLHDENRKPVASFFTVSYIRSDEKGASARPVIFLFNGGPGASSQWLHMGAFGPTRVVMPREPENAGGPPYVTEHNASSLLDVADLVFVDPIGTGFSRALSGDPQRYWGLLEDSRSVADFIRAWLTEQGRWNSPKYLVGESYGTTRACLVAEALSDLCIALNGVVLLAAVLDYQNSRPRPGDGGIMSYASFLPSYAATAWYHDKINRKGITLQSFLDEVRNFARTEYAQALIANERLAESEWRRMVSAVAAYTGLKESYVKQSKLRIPVSRFFKELLRERGVVIGRLDSRFTGVEAENTGEAAESDPTFDAIASAFTCAFNEYLRDLGVRVPRPYVPYQSIKTWNWLLEERAPNGGGYVNVIPHLGRVMRRNKDFRVLVASSYYDLATPFFGAENALSQDGLVRERISYAYYEVGHMIFLDPISRDLLLKDTRAFIRGDAR